MSSQPQFNKAREALAIKQKAEKADLDKKNVGKKKQAKGQSKAIAKEVNKECMKLVEELKGKHKMEVQELEKQFGIVKQDKDEPVVVKNDEAEEQTNVESPKLLKVKTDETPADVAPKKLSKAAKLRLKKEREEKELADRIAAAKLEENQNVGKSPSYLESLHIKKYLNQLNLKEISIKADGSCLFNAILESSQESIQIQGSPTSQEDLRKIVADFLEKNKSEYSGFIENDNFDDYLTKLKSGENWGGHLEISIISKLLKMEISVLKWVSGSSCDLQKFRNFEGNVENSCLIVYYQHLMQSAHYNGTRSN